MKLKLDSEKKVIGCLGLLSILFLARRIVQVDSTYAGRARSQVDAANPMPESTVRKVSLKKTKPAPDLGQLNPSVRLEALKEFLERPAPKFDRNPFEFPPTPQEIKIKQQEAAKQAAPPAPPPPPPVQLQAMGYSESDKGKQVYISDPQETYVVREGEEFAQKYKVLKITPTQAEVEDESSHQSIQLLIPQ